MLQIGCHLSSSKGFLNMGKEIVKLGGNTFQFFTRNPRGGAAKPIDEKDIEAFKTFAKENNINIIISSLQNYIECEVYFMTNKLREPINSITHLAGALLSFIALIAMLVKVILTNTSLYGFWYLSWHNVQ